MSKPRYHIQRRTDFKPGGWGCVTESRSLRYCEGYLDAMDAIYPSVPYRIVKFTPGILPESKVVRETKGGVTK